MSKKEQQSRAGAGAAPKPGDGRQAQSPEVHASAFPIGSGFLAELKRRNVTRMAILYLIACWVILEPTHVVFHMLNVPEWANRLVIILMVIGFPLVVLFAWVFEITPEGLKLTAEVDRSKSITRDTGRKLDRAIIVVLALAVVYLLVDKFWLSRRLVEVRHEQAAATGAPVLAPTAGATATIAGDKSIAVLPFVDMSERHDQEYFSDGLSEELIDHLSHSPDLKVIARTSSFAFKGKNEDIRSIAGKLGVANLLEGSVRKAGNELRITVQLIRASDGTHLWSQTYDRNISGIFKIQDDIAGAVARALQAALSGAGKASSGGESNTEAYNLLLEANFLSDRDNKTDFLRAEELYQRAIELDPNYALAWARLGHLYQSQMQFGWLPLKQGTAKAREALERALRIAPDLAFAHRSLGRFLFYFDWDWKGSLAQYERANELEPGDRHAAQHHAEIIGCLSGRFNEAIEIEYQILARDPLRTAAISEMASNLYFAGRYAESVAAARRALAMNPSASGAYAALAAGLLYLGQVNEALSAVPKESDEQQRLSVSPAVYWALGRKDESNAALEELEVKYAGVSAFDIAGLHAYREEIDAAFQWLNRAYRQRDTEMPYLGVEPRLQNLRKDPRYEALLVKMKLDHAHLPASMRTL